MKPSSKYDTGSLIVAALAITVIVIVAYGLLKGRQDVTPNTGTVPYNSSSVDHIA